MGVDRIDLYLLHEGTPDVLTPDAVAYLQDLRASGQVGELGLAASASRYADLTTRDVAAWDVLQYEAGPGWPASDALLQRFPPNGTSSTAA